MPGSKSSAALKIAAKTDAQHINHVSETRSEMARRLDPKAPATKPSDTAFVSQLSDEALRFQALTSSGATAVAENHVVMDRITATPVTARACHLEGGSFWLTPASLADIFDKCE